MIYTNASITISEMSQKTGVVIRTIKRDIEKLQTSGILTRKGGRKDGEWVLTDLGKSVFDKLTK
jgi:ATP-dependent DNA helicase RecG